MLLKENKLYNLKPLLTKAEVQRIETAVKVILTYTNAYKDIIDTAVDQDTLLLNSISVHHNHLDYTTQCEHVQGDLFENIYDCENGVTAYTLQIMEQLATIQEIIKRSLECKKHNEWINAYNKIFFQAEAEGNEEWH